MDDEQNIYKESTQNIPFLQWLNQKKSNVFSQLYNYIPNNYTSPQLYPNEFIIFLGELFPPHIVRTETSNFFDVAITHIKAYPALTSLIYFVYRSNFSALPNTSLTSDGGWGCTIRACQMLLANAIIKLFGSDNINRKTVIHWFLDFYNSECPYSIHSLFTTQIIVSGNPNGSSFLPFSSVIYALTELVNKDFNRAFECHVITNKFLLKSINKPTIVFIPFTIPDKFDQRLITIFSFNLFAGMVGGSKQKAFYFFGIHHNQLLFLDPHFVRPCASSIMKFDEKDYIAKLSDIKSLRINELERSVVFSFVIHSFQELISLQELAKNVLGIDDKQLTIKREECDGFEVLEF
ncbi:peptidase, C54 family protein [Entamoeba histolytica HM-1:IMSS-B]|uniref:Cysteine protease n=6 Tax=Entamoeba histolytica TaxID=5759 RepID=C4LYR2_ENTH1|nr:peptidase, C54 family [Entamoeba histolytica HM-1:IMSS]EMD45804.1 peptidase C54 family protein [Entamoeba histolytica KU27]EMH72276.1 peptidase, C54 family protein [Entamoeba histolytica HM-1:IMSS-B]EMS13721.1 peptidase, C54 family protein [Entamoeba histolytica HM-3:IMSS]ENY61512.1 peptidase, C54 family protein, putative [Entamoeba histolytica HM-1:IMSS-A]GAT93973.1 peptidase c54 family [Entamoeba histolytica]|eukprot:XP_656724.1 peptidase, C54 family [Entamoeba histolytica HM-1:IMSS]